MTADSFTSTLGTIVMGTGNDNNSWGSNANSLVFQIYEDAIANALTSVVTGGTLDLSGTPPPAAASQVRYAGLIFSGTLVSNQIIKVPNLSKWWFVKNATSGAFTLTLKTPSGSASTAIPQNSGWQVVYCDAADNIVVWPLNTVQLQMPDGSLSAPPYSNINEPSSGWRRAATQDWRLAINGVDVLQVTGAGASSPNIVNTIASFQQSGVALIPPGTEVAYAGANGAPTGWLLEYGQNVSRTTYANLLTAIRAAFTGSFINGSPTITGALPDGHGLVLGTLESATPGVSGLTIASIGGSTVTMSGNATASSGGTVTIYVYPYGNGDGTTTFTLPDRRGRVIAGRDDMGGTSADRISTKIPGSTSLGVSGGFQLNNLTQQQLPNANFTVTGTATVSSVSVTGTVAIGSGQGSHAHAVTGGFIGGASSTSFSAGGTGAPSAATNITISNATLPAMTGTCTATGTGSGTISGTAASGGSGSSFSICQPTGLSNWMIKI